MPFWLNCFNKVTKKTTLLRLLKMLLKHFFIPTTVVTKLSSAQLVQNLIAGPSHHLIDVHVIINSLAYILADGHNFFSPLRSWNHHFVFMAISFHHRQP